MPFGLALVNNEVSQFRTCVGCGGPIVRTHRTALEKLVYAAGFQCAKCKKRSGTPRLWVLRFAANVHCPTCGGTELDRRSTRDYIDAMRWGPTSVLQRLLGGTLYHCHACRVQFYDLRKRKVLARAQTRAAN